MKFKAGDEVRYKTTDYVVVKPCQICRDGYWLTGYIYRPYGLPDDGEHPFYVRDKIDFENKFSLVKGEE